MNTQDDLQPQIRRAIDDEVASVRLKSVEVVPPTRTTTVATAGLMPGFAWLVAVVVVAAIVGAVWRQDAGQRVAGPPTSVDSSAAASASVGAVTSPTISSTPGPSGASSSPACGAVEVGEITVCPGLDPSIADAVLPQLRGPGGLCPVRAHWQSWRDRRDCGVLFIGHGRS